MTKKSLMYTSIDESTVHAVISIVRDKELDDKYALWALAEWDSDLKHGKNFMWHGKMSEEASREFDVKNIVAKAEILSNLQNLLNKYEID
ncbi:MAG: hypothetical protein CL881_07240 [Dehalococcoidia bacterium]|nr:hypothetical protein [Dehalococcoidia bacterium]|tara:strand:- start:84 stop:353 length:270 start_codon:yes stop_codon:yes gene_type:complete